MGIKITSLTSGLLACVLSVVYSFNAAAVTATVKGSLPSVLVESSGLCFNGSQSFWTHNDSWGDNKLYKIDKHGDLVQTITINGATNRNWEDLTHDAARNYMYIGDFGNNSFDRRNLCIYRISFPHSGITSSTATAINFSYPDQHSFPAEWLNFDAEAFFHHNNKFYIFTKADGAAIGYTKMYTVPDAPGTYVATLVDSFYTNDRTTSAAISPDGSSVMLMANSRLHLFRNFSGSDFFNGDHTLISISGGWTQKEAVAFYSNHEIYLTDEDNGSGNNLYYLSLSNYIPASTTTTVEEAASSAVRAFPNPATSFINFELTKAGKNTHVQLCDITGKMVREAKFENIQRLTLSLEGLPAGIYFYRLLNEGILVKSERIMIN